MGKNPGELTGFAEIVDFHEEPTLATSHQRDKEETDTSPAKPGSELRTASISSSPTLPEMDNRSSIPTRRGPDQGNSKLASTKWCTLGLLTIMSCNNMLKDGHNLKLDEGVLWTLRPPATSGSKPAPYVGWEKRAFPSRRIQSSHRFPYGYLVTTSPQSKTLPCFWRLSLLTRFTAYVPFTPSHSGEHLPPRLTAAAGTELAGASSSSHVMIAHSTKELYKRHYPSSLTRYCWIRLSPIVQDSPLLPPVGVRPCLSPSVADHQKRPAKHHWLGQPLPDQLPYPTQAHQTALFSFLQDLTRTVQQIPALSY
ncbi:hypothetical protein ACH5RR_039305 [Cinchona calisaya]|uniref:Uncharacterized protein n=1 Tax=Cinchona calisaya TaxID=153742 RepID=A0ABD2Y1A4_9GENT